MDIAYEEEHHLMEVIMMVEFFIWLWLLLFWIINGISTHDAQPTMCNHIGGVIVAGAATAAMLVVSSSRKIVIISAQTEIVDVYFSFFFCCTLLSNEQTTFVPKVKKIEDVCTCSLAVYMEETK